MKYAFDSFFMLLIILIKSSVFAQTNSNPAHEQLFLKLENKVGQHISPATEYVPSAVLSEGMNASKELFSTSAERTALLPPSNDNCANATVLTVNGSCHRDSTEGATTQSGEFLSPSCAGNTFNQTVWYRFTATASNMWIQLEGLTFSGSGATWAPTYWAAAVYNTNTCLPTSGNMIGCANSSTQGPGDRLIKITLTGLTVGQTYLIQVGYRTGMGVNLIPVYCIRVGDQFTPLCTNCSSPCGPACGFSSTPTVPQVTSTCPAYNQLPYLEGGIATTQCYTFYAVNTTVSFNVIVNSTCQSGNVQGFSWSLYNAGTCGGAIQTGTLSNLTFTGLTIGNQYTYCYSFTVPGDCFHTAYWPYFVGASPLPIELIAFTALELDNSIVLKWSTASEVNNSFYQIERSRDGKQFSKIGIVPGVGNSSVRNDYEFTDQAPLSGTSYYRLKQVDYDQQFEYFGPLAIRYKNSKESLSVFPNPANGQLNFEFSADGNVSYELFVYDLQGQILHKENFVAVYGMNQRELNTKDFENGVYMIRLVGNSKQAIASFIQQQH